MEHKYEIGQALIIKATGKIVTVSQICPGMRDMFYAVFLDGKKTRIKESDLEEYVDPEYELIENIQAGNASNADEFQRFYYFNLFAENQDSNIYSYQGNKIIFNPFQYKPLMKFLSGDSDERLLIADEVGVGKTIEAGIIFDELIARGEVTINDAVMIVCPNILTKKWRDELYTKFGYDDFRVHDGKSLEYMLNGIKDSGRLSDKHSIVSEQLFRSDKNLMLLKECLDSYGEAFIKLLIVDECHHYRNSNTNTNKLGQLLSLSSEKVLMLSATPFNLRSSDLYNQLHMLNPVLFSDESVFDRLKRQVSLVNKSISYLRSSNYSDLKNCIIDLYNFVEPGSVLYDGLSELNKKTSNNEILTEKQTVEYEELLNKFNPVSSSFTRTLKREAIEHRVTRDVRTIEVELTENERAIYDGFIESNILRYKLEGVNDKAINLILNGLERIASSSIPALASNVSRFIDKSNADYLDEFKEENGMDNHTADQIVSVLRDKYSSLMKEIKSLNGTDSKYNAFIELLSKIWEIKGGSCQVIVFSFYVGTLKYLRKKLTDSGYRAMLIYGDTPKETPTRKADEEGFPILGRNEIMERFRKGEFDILLASEVGGEGLDFQFCSALINYDIPYNPMRIEQRIGRIDRMGQKEDKIIIGNLCIADTIDIIINRVLMERINEASVLIGELEPIIAQKMEEINSLIIKKSFSDKEIIQREKEMLNRIEKEKKQREEFDSIRFELVNDSGFRDEFERKIKSSRLSPEKSMMYTAAFLKTLSGCWSKKISDTAAIIHITNDLREKVAARYRIEPSEELKALCASKEDICISFSGDEAYDSERMIFFKPSGSWIHFITDYIVNVVGNTGGGYYVGEISDKDAGIPKGQYFVFVYEVEYNGFRNTKYFEYILVDSKNGEVISLDEETRFDTIIMSMRNVKRGTEVDLNGYDDALMSAQEELEIRQAKYYNELESVNGIKIKSHIEAIKVLSENRVNELEKEIFMSCDPKEIEKNKRAIDRIKRNTEKKVAILSEKLKIVSSYSIKAMCVLFVR